MIIKYLKFLYYFGSLTLLLTVFTNYKATLVNKSKGHIQKLFRAIKKPPRMKYILQWTAKQYEPLQYMGVGQKGFIERNCEYVNCFLTSDKTYLGNYTEFDAIVFGGPEATKLTQSKLPRFRSPNQKYIFATMESADNYPLCSGIFDGGFFNWTWTYKVDSDIRWGYIVIRDKDNNIIGPKKEMHWLKLEDMDPVSDPVKEQLKSKSKAVTWFSSNCHSKSKREEIGYQLKTILYVKYKQELDIYGRCGLMSCSRNNEEKCNKLIENIYYFYLSFENSLSEDYVTEKLLYPLKNNAVPIVFGGANYTRFMPHGAYLDARALSVEKLAATIDTLIQKPKDYFEYFRWKNHYSYHSTSESVETNEYCRLCSLINNDSAITKTTIYEKFQEWWDPPHLCKT